MVDFPCAVLLWVVAARSGTVVSSWREETCKLGREDAQKLSRSMKISALAQEHQPFTWKSAVLQGGNNSLSVLCSPAERIRNYFTAEGKAPRQMQEACAGEVRSAACYPAPFSPLWADRVARSVTKRKWCGSQNWQGGNFVGVWFFFLLVRIALAVYSKLLSVRRQI